MQINCPRQLILSLALIAVKQIRKQDETCSLLFQMFERETARERNLEKAAKEAKNKARKEAGKAGDTEKTLTEEDLEQVTNSVRARP